MIERRMRGRKEGRKKRCESSFSSVQDTGKKLIGDYLVMTENSHARKQRQRNERARIMRMERSSLTERVSLVVRKQIRIASESQGTKLASDSERCGCKCGSPLPEVGRILDNTELPKHWS